MGNARTSTTTSQASEEDADVRSGPWTAEEDFLLVNYINMHGEGRWNSLAPSAGLKRTGKSCRLRWLNYLRPNVRRGNITLEEQLLILELHFHLGNRWSKIAQHLPGRTDNEIKNYWRTRVQKHAKQLKCDVNSKKFKDVMRYVWIPRLQERIQAANLGTAAARQDPASQVDGEQTAITGSESGPVNPISESSCGPVSSFDRSSVGTHVSSPVMVTTGEDTAGEWIQGGEFCEYWSGPLASPCSYSELELPDFDWWQGGEFSANLWNMEDNWII